MGSTRRLEVGLFHTTTAPIRNESAKLQRSSGKAQASTFALLMFFMILPLLLEAIDLAVVPCSSRCCWWCLLVVVLLLQWFFCGGDKGCICG